MATTVAVTAALIIEVKVNFGLGVTSLVMGALLLMALTFQFRCRRWSWPAVSASTAAR